MAENDIKEEEKKYPNTHYNDSLISDNSSILNDEKEYKSLIDEYNDVIKESFAE